MVQVQTGQCYLTGDIQDTCVRPLLEYRKRGTPGPGGRGLNSPAPRYCISPLRVSQQTCFHRPLARCTHRPLVLPYLRVYKAGYLHHELFA
jgi:hypothetical protein